MGTTGIRAQLQAPRLDLRAAAIDTVVAGGFTAAVFGAATHSVRLAVLGAGLGGASGALLHLVPQHFDRAEPRLPRLAMRIATGGLAGGVLGAAVAGMSARNGVSRALVTRGAVGGLIGGGASYALWGALEPRST